jgi:3-dehydroquinate dehydratase-2
LADATKSNYGILYAKGDTKSVAFFYFSGTDVKPAWHIHAAFQYIQSVMATVSLLILNGANLSRLGKREPRHYGTRSLEDINEQLVRRFPDLHLEFFQSEYEGALIEKLYEAEDQGKMHGIVLNAGAYTHYSLALRDAISAIKLPVVEVHLSNIYAREAFRRTSVLSEVCIGVVSGFGEESYALGILALLHHLKHSARHSGAIA